MPELKWRPCPFRFENIWLQDEGFQKLVDSLWLTFSVVIGFAGYVLTKRLKFLSWGVKDRRKNTIGQNLLEEVSIEETILAVHLEEEKDNIDYFKRLLHLSLLEGELSFIALAKARLWRQKCKKLWLLKVDKNTTFFYRMCIAHQMKSFISEITDQVEDQASLLIMSFIDIEILDTIKSLGQNKAPGLSSGTLSTHMRSAIFFVWQIFGIVPLKISLSFIWVCHLGEILEQIFFGSLFLKEWIESWTIGTIPISPKERD